MPAKDLYHDIVKNALLKEGWTITHDPYMMSLGKKDLFIDLGAEKLLAAEKSGRKIAVEVKSFVGKSEVQDLRNALGQFVLYRHVLQEKEPDRELFLAVRESVFVEVFQEPIGEILIRKGEIRLIVFDKAKEEIRRWIP